MLADSSKHKLDRIKEYLLLFESSDSVMSNAEFKYEKFVEAMKLHNRFILDIIEE